MSHSKSVVVTGAYDDLRSRHLRFLQEAARYGEVSVLVWPDEAVRRLTGSPPKFPLAERLYTLNAVRYVCRAVPGPAGIEPDAPPALEGPRPEIWVDGSSPANSARLAACHQGGIEYRVLPPAQLAGFPEPPARPAKPGRKRVVVTGCYDWLHSGHVRFFEEVSAYGELYVIVGHDANLRLLKGPGHPLLPERERRYLVDSIRYVTQALISTGSGWLDADPEIQRLKPDIYAVNQDGDQGGKREYCARRGIQYVVLKRLPAPGLAPRTSTGLRGF